MTVAGRKGIMRQETIDRCERVHELITQGSTQTDAIKEVGVAMSTYHAYRDTTPATKIYQVPQAQRVQRMSRQANSRVALLLGSTDDILRVLRSL